VTTQEEFPFGAPTERLHTVSELTQRIKHTLESRFPDVWVTGEISQWTRAASGHIYLTLKDEHAVLKGILWRPVASAVRFQLEEGLQVLVRGSVEVYAPRGTYQLIIQYVQPRGIGALQLAFRQLVAKLEKEGLFAPEHKKPLPRFPKEIGIITSAEGAAVRDMIRVMTRRWPLAHLHVLPRRVQGAGAAEELAAGVLLLNRAMPQLDLIVVGRGGGSMEDLWAFNEEVLARAIFASEIPVVSAVGHEVDITVADLVADLRAATPTEAGEKAVPDRVEVERTLHHLQKRLGMALETRMRRSRQRLDSLSRSPALRRPGAMLRERAQRADEVFERMRSLIHHRLELVGEKLNSLRGALDALSPLRVLERGYSITFGPTGELLRCTDGLCAGETIRTRLLAGEIVSSITELHPPDDTESER